MKTFLILFLSELKMIVRNRQALFWRLVFPIIFVVIFGLFNLDSFTTSKIVVIDEAGTTTSQSIADGLQQGDLFKTETAPIDQLSSYQDKLKQDEIGFILVIPPSASNLPDKSALQSEPGAQNTRPTAASPSAPIPLKVYYNEANVATNQIVLNALGQLTTEINAAASGAPKLFELQQEALSDKKIRYIDFLIPGIIAMSLMNSAINGTAVYVTDRREKKILKRVLVTPVDRKSYIAATVIAQLVMSFVQAIIIVATGKILYGVNMYGSWLDATIVVLLGTLIFINIGFAIAAFSKTTQAAESLAQIIALPMMFLSGVFFSTESLPFLVKKIVDYLPLTAIIDSLRKIILNGESLKYASHDMLIAVGWIVATFLVSAFTFRLAKE